MQVKRLKLIGSNNVRQNKLENSFYHSKQWRSIRKEILIDEPLCRECQRKGYYTAASVVDHIIPIRLGGNKLDKSNLQPLCKPCHESKSSYEKKYFK